LGIKQADYDWAEVDFAAIESRAAGYREDSCWARQSPETEECLNLVAAVMAAVPTQWMLKGEILELIVRKASTEKINRRLWCLPDEMTAEQFLTHLLHQGALQSRLGGNWACPFPSFRT